MVDFGCEFSLQELHWHLGLLQMYTGPKLCQRHNTESFVDAKACFVHSMSSLCPPRAFLLECIAATCTHKETGRL